MDRGGPAIVAALGVLHRVGEIVGGGVEFFRQRACVSPQVIRGGLVFALQLAGIDSCRHALLGGGVVFARKGLLRGLDVIRCPRGGMTGAPKPD